MRLALADMTKAIEAICDGDLLLASRCMQAANRSDVRNHFAVVAGPVRDGRPKKRPVTHRASVRMPPIAIRRTLYVRDRWHCRFCQTPVVDPEAVMHLRRLMPTDFFAGRRNAETHSVVLALRASPDHLLPRCYGGTNDLDNLATACGCCQFGRGDWMLEDVGIAQVRPPVETFEWDGLRGVMRVPVPVVA